MSITSVVNDTVTRESTYNAQKPLAPTISGYVIDTLDDTALDPSGGQTILINGEGFLPGATISFSGNTVSSVTLVSAYQLSFTSPAKSAGTYTIYVVNPDGGTAVYIPGIIYSTLPTWTTSSGSLGSYYETTNISNTLVASGDAPIVYSLESGSLPTGSTLYANGVISGTSPVDGSSTTYSFTVKATDAQNQESTRSFSITINTDVVTWSNPSNDITYTNPPNVPISNITLSATSAAGANVTYTANSLPTGLTLDNGVISGTPTVEANTSTLLTATAATTRTSTKTIMWSISVAGDNYFKNTALLLSGSANTFVKDSSNNNFNTTITGDVKPSNFNPHLTGWSNYFDGSGDYLSLPNSSSFAFGTADFTIEFWINTTDTAAGLVTQAVSGGWALILYNSTLYWQSAYNATNLWTYSAASIINGAWHHLAFSRVSGSTKFFIDGVLVATNADSTNYATTSGNILIGRDANPSDLIGYISNLRIIKGTGIYTSNFTPPTSPLTAISGTSLLTCADNRFIDKSSNASTITKGGDVATSTISPFTQDVSTNGSGYFDGSGDYLTFPNNTAFDFGTGDFTVEAWVNFSSTSSRSSLIGATASGSFDIQLTVPGNLLSVGRTNTSYDFQTTYAFSIGQWTHVAIARSAGTIRCFINGVLLNSAASNINYSQNGGTGSIGAAAGSEHFLNGYISNLRVVKGTAVYTSAFTPPTSPLTAIANTSLLTLQTNTPINNNLILDSSGLNNVVTRNGNTTQGSFSPYSPHNWSNYFDGSGDYLSVPNNSALDLGSGDYTIEGWWYFTDTSNQAMVSKYTADNGYVVQYQANNLRMVLGLGSSDAVYSFAWTPIPNTWNHVAITRSGTNGRAFINGAQIGSTTTFTTSNVSASTTLQIGSTHTVSELTRGYVSNFRLVKGTAVYTSNFTPPTAPLTAISGTSILTCADNRFIDESPYAHAITRNGDTRITNFAPFKSHVQPPTSYSTYFDGTGDYLTATGNTAFNPGTQDFTIECWTYRQTTDATNRKAIGTTRPVSGTLAGWVIFVETTGYVGLGGWNSAGTLVLNYVATANPIVNNVWTHVAVVKVGNDFTIYMNGVASGTGTASATLADGTNFYLGTEPQVTTRDWNGYISNFRIVKGTAVYTSNFTPSTTPLTAITNTSLLICQDSTLIDKSTNGYTITATAGARPTMVNPFGSSYTSTNGYTAAQHGGSMYFDGTGDYLSGSILPPRTGVVTVEAWVYVTDRSAARCVFTSRSGNTTDGFQIVVDSGGEVRVGYSGLNFINSATNSVVVNQWYHLAVTRNSANLMTLWINGISSGTSTRTNDFSSTTYRVGFTAENGNPMFGYISGVRIVNRNLYTSNFFPPVAPVLPVQSTVLLLNGTSGGIVDATTRNVVETVGDAKITNAVSKFGGSSMYFNSSGSGGYIKSSPVGSSTFGTANFTIEMWLYPQSAIGYQCILLIGATNPYIFLGVNTGSTGTPFMWNDGNVIVGSQNFTLNTWQHWAVVRNSGTVTMYLNGTSIGSASFTGNVVDNSGVYLGANSTAGQQYSGYVQDLRITRGIARYTTNFTPPTTAFLVESN